MNKVTKCEIDNNAFDEIDNRCTVCGISYDVNGVGLVGIDPLDESELNIMYVLL